MASEDESPWAGLGDVDWSVLRHHHGSAADVPDLLRRVRAGDVEALSDLDGALLHQGRWTPSAATAALPFLVDVAVDVAHPSRPGVLELIGLLAGGAATRTADVDPGWGEAWCRAFATLAFSDMDPALWSFLVEASSTVVADPDLVSSLRASPDVRRRMVAVAVDAPAVSDEDATTIAEALYSLDPASSAEVDVVAAIAEPVTDSAVFRRFLPEPSTAAADTTTALRLARTAAERWPSMVDAVLPVLAVALDSDDHSRRRRALHLAGCLGTAAAPVADRVAALVHDVIGKEPLSNGDIAIWALTRMRDRRAIPRLAALLGGVETRYGHRRVHTGFAASVDVPAIGEILEPLAAWADDLLPVLCARIGRLHRGETDAARDLITALGAWGPTASDAGPTMAEAIRRTRLVDPLLLDVVRVRPQCPVRLPGPDATGDAGFRRVVAIARHALRGDTEAVRSEAAVVVASEDPRTAARFLSRIGPLAAEHETYLRRLLPDRDPRSAPSAAAVHAAVALTGFAVDVAEPVAVLVDAVAGPVGATTVRALTRLLDLGDAARPVLPALRALLARDERLSMSRGWRRFSEDDRVRTVGARLATGLGAAVA